MEFDTAKLKIALVEMVEDLESVFRFKATALDCARRDADDERAAAAVLLRRLSLQVSSLRKRVKLACQSNRPGGPPSQDVSARKSERKHQTPIRKAKPKRGDLAHRRIEKAKADAYWRGR